MFSDKVICITGGTGSFGEAALNRFLDTDVREIRIFSRDEKKQDDMRKKYNNEKLEFYIGDVRDRLSIRDALHGVDYIFHAAALKQVPSCEFFPMEAVKTNIIGTDNVLNEAIAMKVKKVICLSTDKAAYPINAMGISKAMMEKVIIAKARTVSEKDTMICCTRYGNVMASRGSVIPLFLQQIKEGRPLTVTNPKMTRFLMSLNEAVDLVIYAFKNAHSGDILVQKSVSCYIGDLAVAINRLMNSETSIKIIGTRHGEKLYETLLTSEESIQCEDLGDFYRVPADKRSLNYEKYIDRGNEELSIQKAYSSHDTTILTVEEIMEKLMSVASIRAEIENWRRF